MYSLHRTWLQHVGSPSIPRDGTCPASLAVQSLSHGTPRAVPMLKVFIHDPRVLFRPRDSETHREVHRMSSEDSLFALRDGHPASSRVTKARRCT